MSTDRFQFAFDPRFRPLLAGIGIRPGTSGVILHDDTLEVRFGRWQLTTPISNIKDVRITRGYRWFRAIGVRRSFVDGGATFGTNTHAGVCVCFHEPVPALFGDRVRHPALTVTVAEPEAFAEELRRRIDPGGPA